jgi:Uma2 family endonuclease
VRAPTICTEVVSPTNTRREIAEKVSAYLDAGAKEVIVVETSGLVRHFGAEGERATSAFGLALTLPAGTYPAKG